MKRTTLAGLILLGACSGAGASDLSRSAAGTSGSEFLTIDAGARGTSMAGAYSAVTDDAYSMYWNPAGLANIPRASVALMNIQYLAGINYYYAAYAQRIRSWGGVLGGAIRYLDAGSVARTDVDGVSIGSFRPRSFVYEAGFGQPVADLEEFGQELLVGGAFRLLHSEYLSQADGYAMDIGAQTRSDAAASMPYRYGVVVQNLGRGQKFDQVRDSLPVQTRLGGAVELTSQWLTSAELVLPVANQPYGAVGTELSVEPLEGVKAALRSGFETQSFSNGLDGFRGVDFGIGCTVSQISFDYAFVPYGNLGDVHRFSLTYNFPSKTAKKYRER